MQLQTLKNSVKSDSVILNNDFIEYAHYFPDGNKTLISETTNQTSKKATTSEKPTNRVLPAYKPTDRRFLKEGKNQLVMSPDAIGLTASENHSISYFIKSETRSPKLINTIAVSTDSKRILIAFRDSIIRQYLTPEGITDWLKKYPDLNFNVAEKDRYFIQ